MNSSVFFSDFKSIPKIDIEKDEYYLFHYSSDIDIDQDMLKYYLEFLTPKLKKEVLKYRRLNDRYNCLFGKLFIYMGAYLFGDDCFSFEKILKNSYGKPYIKNSKLNFNISHSGNTVICVFSKQEIGVDIEEISETEFSLFENIFSFQEIAEIKSYGLNKFYEFWTKKESVIKGIGKGMSIPLKEIEIDNRGHITYGDDTWYTKSFKMDTKYCSISSRCKLTGLHEINVIF